MEKGREERGREERGRVPEELAGPACWGEHHTTLEGSNIWQVQVLPIEAVGGLAVSISSSSSDSSESSSSFACSEGGLGLAGEHAEK